MPRINLLPWREEQRQKLKKEFMLLLVGALLFGSLVVFASKLTVQSWTNDQRERNEILRAEIAVLDQQIAEISGLEAQKNRLLARMEIIDQLQRSRPEVVHLFDEMVDTLPEGVHLTEVRQEGNRVQIVGEAQSSTRVSVLMRNIDGSDWLREPALDVIETRETGPSRNSRFTLFAQQIPMAENAEDAL